MSSSSVLGRRPIVFPPLVSPFPTPLSKAFGRQYMNGVGDVLLPSRQHALVMSVWPIEGEKVWEEGMGEREWEKRLERE